MNGSILETIQTIIVEGDDRAAAENTREALAKGIDPLEMPNGGIVPGIQRAGELWKANPYFLPDVVLSAEAFKAALQPVEPLLKKRGAPTYAVA